MADRAVAISLRAPPHQRSLIDQATRLLGKNRSDFMRDAACERAQSVTLDQTLFELSPERFRRFAEMLDAPTATNPGLERLPALASPWDAA